MGNQQVKLRSGATEYGRIYEQRIAAWLSIKCAMDSSVADFWIVSNVDGVGAFDDIVLWIEYTDSRRKMYCIQLKHMETNKLSIKELTFKDSKFGLVKYAESYKEIAENIDKIHIFEDISTDQIYLILYTNAPLDGHKTKTIFVKNRDSIELLNTSSKQNNTFQVFNSSTSIRPFDETFLQQFYLFERQASAGQMDRLIKNEFYSHFQDVGNNVLITITDYFAKWAIGKKGKITKITKTHVQRMLLELMLLPHTMEPSEVAGNEEDKLNILNDTLTNFNVTAISRESLLRNIFASIKCILEKLCGAPLNFQLSWNTHLTDAQTDYLMKQSDHHLMKSFLQEKQRYVPYLTVRDLYLAAWQCKLIPLIINCNIYQNSVAQILIKFKEVTKDLSFVLLNPNSTDDLAKNLKVFGNINDIDDSSLLIRNLENTHVSLQGKDNVQLKQFMTNRKILEQITPDVYMILLEGVLRVGQLNEVENYYIKRDIQRPLLSMDVLDESNVIKDRQSLQNQRGDIFLLLEFAGGVPFKHDNNLIGLQGFLENILQNNINEKEYIVVTNLTNQRVESIAANMHEATQKSVHLMRVQQNCLEWLYSIGNVESLEDYIIETTLSEGEDETRVHEDDMLQHFKSTTNIICNNAGMGKTFMLRSLANKFDGATWACYINLSEHVTELLEREAHRDVVKYVFDCEMKHSDEIVHEFCEKIYAHCFEQNSMVWLLDGYDEVSSENILSFLESLKEHKVRTWITTRPTYRRELELKLDALAVELTHFSKDDHVSFLWKYFETYNHRYNYNEDQIQYIIDTIDKCSSNLDKSFIAIPLQTRMFAEIFGDDINQVGANERLTLVDLYNKFVNIKLKEYKSYEATSMKKTLSKLALKIFFKDDQLDVLLDFEELAEEAVAFQESYKKDSIVIGLNEKGEAVFGHRTFAEFLAAHWLAKQIVHHTGKYNMDWVPLIEKLYYSEMLPVRAFFDRILAQNMPLHVAVLNNDLERVQALIEDKELQNNTDKLGRSALHLAVSYGTFYDLYVTGEIKGLKSVGLHAAFKDGDNQCDIRIARVSGDQYLVSKEVVEKLITSGFPNTTDKLFNYDAFDYAMKSCSLGFVDVLYSKFEKASLRFESSYNFKIFLYLVVYDNFYRILSERLTYDFDVSNFPRQKDNKLRGMFEGDNLKLLKMKYEFYLTEVAAFTGGKEAIYELLQSGALQVDVGHAVHKACINGHADVVDLLHKMGADLNQADDYGWSPIYQSARSGREDVTYQFLKDKQFRANLTKNKCTLMTPLHYASQGGHSDCVKKLIENKANIKQKDAFGYSPLMYAVLYGHVNTIESLLVGIPKDELQADKEIRAALNTAASKGYRDCVKKLLELGLDANNVDDDGNTPVILASQNGFAEVIEELAMSCDVNLMKTNATLDNTLWYSCQNNHIILHTKLLTLGGNRMAHGSITALHLAVRNGRQGCVETLVAFGADASIEDTISGVGYVPVIWASMYGRDDTIQTLLGKKRTNGYNQKEINDINLALIWSSILGYHKCTKVLLQNTASTYSEDEELTKKHLERVKKLLNAEFGWDGTQIDATGNMPLLFAAKNGHANVIQELASKKYMNNDGLNATALKWAAVAGDVETVKLLIELGVDENQKNDKGLRVIPIVWASMYGRTGVVQHLLSNKSESYLENRDVHLALNWAALGGHYDCVKILLDFGLDVNNVDEELNGNTPLISACEYRGTPQVIDELLARNCLVNKQNSNGLTALHFASEKKQFGICKKLLIGALNNLDNGENSSALQQVQSAMISLLEDDNALAASLAELGIGANTAQKS